MSDLWINVPNWPKFQHYKKREPVWIKLYLELRSRDDWRQLRLGERGLLVSIWIEYAASNGHLRVTDLHARLGKRIPRRALDSLLQAGLIEVSASRPLAVRALAREDKTSVASQQTDSQDALRALPTDETPEPNPLADKLIGEIRDADRRTAAALRGFQHRLPDAAFAAALESLRYRREHGSRPLTSEARYVVATLSTMVNEGQYR